MLLDINVCFPHIILLPSHFEMRICVNLYLVKYAKMPQLFYLDVLLIK